jgi:hypothetical protein
MPEATRPDPPPGTGSAQRSNVGSQRSAPPQEEEPPAWLSEAPPSEPPSEPKPPPQAQAKPNGQPRSEHTGNGRANTESIYQDAVGRLKETIEGTDADAPLRFEFVTFDQLKASNISLYTVKNVFSHRGLAIVWGPPKCGKSFWVFTVMMFVALGWKYRGHRVTQGEVVYLALEGRAGFDDRAEAFRAQYLVPDREGEPAPTVPAFKLCGASLDLIKDHHKLIADIRTQSIAPRVVVIDTLNRSLVGSESSDEDMAAYIKAAYAIEEAFGCLVVVIHHCGVNDNRPRGHTSQTGAAEVQIAVRKEADGVVTATVELAKDMPEGTTFASRLKVVELCKDQDGDPKNTCVVVPIEAEEGSDKPVQSGKREKLTKGAQTALRALREAVDEVGAVPPASNHIPAKIKTVTTEQWRDYAYRRGISTGEDRAKQQAFKRASEHLIGSEPPFAKVWDGQVWLTRN